MLNIFGQERKSGLRVGAISGLILGALLSLGFIVMCVWVFSWGNDRSPVDEARIWRERGLLDFCPKSHSHALTFVGFQFQDADGYVNYYPRDTRGCNGYEIWVEYAQFSNPWKAKEWLKDWSPEVQPGVASWAIDSAPDMGAVVSMRYGKAVGSSCTGDICKRWEYFRRDGRTIWMMSVHGGKLLSFSEVEPWMAPLDEVS
ncbi:MAG: hypothetical protein ACRDAX_04365 [Propionibacteriaceae bacterium]